MSQRAPLYLVDPNDPRAPSQEIWDRLTPEERDEIVASLPSELPVSEANPPEGDAHFNAKMRARVVLGGFFARIGRRIYLACELPIYYANERMFAPDVIAVADVEPHERERWTVTTEGKGLDFALEVLVSGDRRKDLERNVERYARLGIAEYFVFDRARLRLSGYSLPSAAGAAYQPIIPQGGRYASRILGLDLAIDGDKLRFFHGMAPLPEAEELVASLERIIDRIEARAVAAEERAEHETRLRENETRLRENETRLREDAERRLAEALAEVERLKAGPGGRPASG